jgi:hypothetical protein
MPKGISIIKQNGMITTKPKGFSTINQKDTSPLWRQRLFNGKLAKSFETKLSCVKFPTQVIPGGTSLFRFIDQKYNLSYFQVFSQLPPGPRRGADSLENRWSGRKSDGLTPGISGSYWGSTDGVSAETFFYSCLKGYDPSAGILRLLPNMAALFIGGLSSRLPYCPEGVDVPPELPFSGNYSMNIVIAKTICNIETANMDVTSDQFKDWAHGITKSLRAELDDLEFDDIGEAIQDGEFREISRLVGNSAYDKGCNALRSKSTRRHGYNAPAYDPTNANNVVLFGKDGEPITGMLVGKGVIKVRPSTEADARGPGAKATIEPMSVYPSPPNSMISLYNPPDSSLLAISNTGPSGQILLNSTEPTGDGESAE